MSTIDVLVWLFKIVEAFISAARAVAADVSSGKITAENVNLDLIIAGLENRPPLPTDDVTATQ